MAPDDSRRLQMAPEAPMATKAAGETIHEGKKLDSEWVWEESSEYETLTPQPTIWTKLQLSPLELLTQRSVWSGRQKSGIYTNCENKHTLMFSRKVTEWNRTKSQQIKSNRTTKTWLEPNRPALKKLGSKQMKLYRPKPRSIKSKQTTSY